MFKGFDLEFVKVPSVAAGFGMAALARPFWFCMGILELCHVVAGRRSARFGVVCPDLASFGRSKIPSDTADHSGSSKRAKARARVELMSALDHRRLAVVGHNRVHIVRGAIGHTINGVLNLSFSLLSVALDLLAQLRPLSSSSVTFPSPWRA